MKLTSSQAHQFDHILLCGPSGALLDEDSFDRGCTVIRDFGLPVIEQGNVRARHERFAGLDGDRINALNTAFGMRQTGLVIASRGGYGVTRLLPDLDWARIVKDINTFGHVFCGHSDITALQLSLLKFGVEGKSLLHGPMVCFDFGCEQGPHPVTLSYLERALGEGKVDISWQVQILGAPNSERALSVSTVAQLNTSGPAWGGNLSMVCSLIGTPYMPDVVGGVLILEEVNEPAFRVERMLLQLHQAGVLEKQSAIILGDVGLPEPSQHDHGFGLSSIIDFVYQACATPIVSGFPFGHCRPKACFYQGVNCHLVVEGTQARLSQTL